MYDDCLYPVQYVFVQTFAHLHKPQGQYSTTTETRLDSIIALKPFITSPPQMYHKCSHLPCLDTQHQQKVEAFLHVGEKRVIQSTVPLRSMQRSDSTISLRIIVTCHTFGTVPTTPISSGLRLLVIYSQ